MPRAFGSEGRGQMSGDDGSNDSAKVVVVDRGGGGSVEKFKRRPDYMYR